MENGWNVWVISTDHFAIANIDVTISIWLTIISKWSINWSSIFGKTQYGSVCQTFRKCFCDDFYNIIIRHFVSIINITSISLTSRSCVIVERTLSLGMSQAPIDLFKDSIRVCDCSIDRRVVRINTFCWNTIEKHHSSSSNTPSSILSSGTRSFLVPSCRWNIGILWSHDIANRRIQFILSSDLFVSSVSCVWKPIDGIIKLNFGRSSHWRRIAMIWQSVCLSSNSNYSAFFEARYTKFSCPCAVLAWYGSSTCSNSLTCNISGLKRIEILRGG